MVLGFDFGSDLIRIQLTHIRMVLGYLAYETLGRLVELCLLVRRDAARLFPFVLSQISRFEGQHSVRIDLNC